MLETYQQQKWGISSGSKSVIGFETNTQKLIHAPVKKDTSNKAN